MPSCILLSSRVLQEKQTSRANTRIHASLRGWCPVTLLMVLLLPLWSSHLFFMGGTSIEAHVVQDNRHWVYCSILVTLRLSQGQGLLDMGNRQPERHSVFIHAYHRLILLVSLAFYFTGAYAPSGCKYQSSCSHLLTISPRIPESLKLSKLFEVSCPSQTEVQMFYSGSSVQWFTGLVPFFPLPRPLPPRNQHPTTC
jgi:hypothetical protein